MSKENTLLDAMAKENQSLADLLGMNEAKTEDITLLKKLAEEGNKDMMTLLGIKYMTGEGVPKDTMEGMYWLEKSGDFVSLIQMGDFYRDNGEADLAEELYLKAVDKADDPCGTYMKLISLFMKNPKSDSSLQKFDKYLRAAFAANPDENAKKILYDLSDILCDLISKDDKERYAYWLEKSLERKEDDKKRALVENIYAQILIGEKSSEESKRIAAEYFEKRGNLAVDNGVIGMFYYYNDPAMDAEKRIVWTKRAADRGWANAQLVLSLAYLGKEFNKKIILDQNLDACLQYANLLEKNPKATAKDLETVAKIRNTVKAERDKKTKVVEKHLTEKDAKELAEQLKKSGGTKLVIPEGYTHIDDWALHHGSHKIFKEITEIVYPESLVYIGTSFGLCSLTKIVLPKGLKMIAGGAFDGTTAGFLGIEKQDNRTVPKLVIPGSAEVAGNRDIGNNGGGLLGINTIGELIFEDGPKTLSWWMFYKNRINYMYIPDSVKKIENAYKDDKGIVKIDKVSAPAHLKDKLTNLQNWGMIKNIEYR
ncbi:MAG: leucine-rich repeat protein [Lachnospiraceae bacterium]|nr:leucine-rich repeat protein [Lachnospiraceae bacterium]